MSCDANLTQVQLVAKSQRRDCAVGPMSNSRWANAGSATIAVNRFSMPCKVHARPLGKPDVIGNGIGLLVSQGGHNALTVCYGICSLC